MNSSQRDTPPANTRPCHPEQRFVPKAAQNGLAEVLLYGWEGGHYVIDVERLLAHRLDEPEAAALAALGDDPRAPVAPDVRARLDELGLLESAAPASSNWDLAEPAPIASIAIFVAQTCNLSCVYCYGGDGEYGAAGRMDSGTAQRAVDWLIGQSRGLTELGISFFGGEPLLNFGLIQEVVAYARQQGAQKGKHFRFALTTNATLLDEERSAYLKQHEVEVYVSFDGSKQVQDRNRPFKRGGGSSYEVALPRIRAHLAAAPRTECRVTVTGPTDTVQVQQEMRQLGFRSIHFALAADSEHNSKSIQGAREAGFAELLRLHRVEAEEIVQAVQRRDGDFLRGLTQSVMVAKLLGNFLSRKKHNFHCGAGRGYAAVSASGDVYACHRFVGVEQHKIGRVDQAETSREFYQHSPIGHVEKCTSCPARYVCSGGCMHDHEGRTGSPSEPAPEWCDYMRAVLMLIGAMSCRLSAADRAFMLAEGLIEGRRCALDF